MHENLLMGIDCGTSMIKTVIFDVRGNEIAVDKHKTNVINPLPNCSEINMDTLWESTKKSIIRALNQLNDNHGIIKAIGVTGTASGLWGLDKEKKPVGNAILWNDGRAASLLDLWKKTGLFDQIFEIGGNAIFPGHTIVLAKWLKNNIPKKWDTIKYLVFNKDWINFKLTKEIHTDPSDIGYLPGDIKNRSYSQKIFEMCGIQDISAKLPVIKESGEITGYLQKELADELGIEAGIPVITGLTDVASATLGAGVFKPGAGCSVVGTSCINSLVTDRALFEPKGLGINCPTVNNCWLRSMVNTAGTLNIDMALNILNIEDNNFNLLEELAARSKSGANGLIYLPYVNTSGVVSPIVHPYARGVLSGLCFNQSREDVARAIYEGLALSINDSYSNLPFYLREISLSGGGAKSKLLSQIIADCTEKEITIPRGLEYGAKGVAMLAGISSGIFENLESAVETMTKGGHKITPSREKHDFYQNLFRKYINLRDTMVKHWDFLSELQLF